MGSLPTGQGYQCADCGLYFPRNRIKDIDGEYYCRDAMGHNHPSSTEENTMIHVGTKFSTRFEAGCLATSEPDALGNFDGIDSDGVEVQFHIAMVTQVEES